MAAFGAPQGALQGSWGDIRVQDATLAETAAVLLGRADLQDLTGAGYPSRLADEVHICFNKRGGVSGAWQMGCGCVLWVVVRLVGGLVVAKRQGSGLKLYLLGLYWSQTPQPPCRRVDALERPRQMKALLGKWAVQEAGSCPKYTRLSRISSGVTHA